MTRQQRTRWQAAWGVKRAPAGALALVVKRVPAGALAPVAKPVRAGALALVAKRAPAGAQVLVVKRALAGALALAARRGLRIKGAKRMARSTLVWTPRLTRRQLIVSPKTAEIRRQSRLALGVMGRR